MTAINTPDTTTASAAGGARKGRRRADADGTLPADVPQQVEAPVGACAVMGVLVRVAGAVPIRLDMSHAGTHEMQLGLSLGTILIYLRTAITAHAIADGWANAALAARGLPMSAIGKRPMPVGPSTVGAMARMAGVPRVTTGWQDAVPGTTRPALLRIQAGPVTWEVCDTAAYRRCCGGGGRPRRCSTRAPPSTPTATSDRQWGGQPLKRRLWMAGPGCGQPDPAIPVATSDEVRFGHG